MKIAIIGAGNMGGAIARGLAKGTKVKATDIICSDHAQATLDRLNRQNPAIQTTTDNAEAVRHADLVLLALKPWLMESVIRELKSSFDYSRQILISIAAGVTTEQLTTYLENESKEVPPLYRLIPNTAIDVLNSMTFICPCGTTSEQDELVLGLFRELGDAMLVEERLMGAGTALASCGIAFAMRYIRAAMVGGVEMGFYPQQSKEIVLQTVKGAVELLMANGTDPEPEIDKVTTPGGITIKGLNEMEHAGFTSAVIRGLKAANP